MASTRQERDCDGNRKTTGSREKGIVMEMGKESQREYGAVKGGNNIEWEGEINGDKDGANFF